MVEVHLNFSLHFSLTTRRDEIRFANLALISGRQMSTRASTVSIFLVAIIKKCLRHSQLPCPSIFEG